MIMEKSFFTIIEFAQKLNAHPNTIRRMIKSHRIQAVRLGNGRNSSYRIPASEINRIAEFDLNLIIQKEIEKKNAL